MVRVNIPSYKPARMEIIPLGNDDIMKVSGTVQEPTQTPGSGLGDDSNIDNDW